MLIVDSVLILTCPTTALQPPMYVKIGLIITLEHVFAVEISLDMIAAGKANKQLWNVCRPVADI